MLFFPNKNAEAPSWALFSFHLSFFILPSEKKKLAGEGFLPASGCLGNGPCFQDSPMQFTSNNFNAPKISVALHESGNLG